MQEHRWVWEQTNGPIPKGYVIHHIDHDKTNNDISNLQCLTVREHHQLHAEQEGKQTYESPEAYLAAHAEYQRQWRQANREKLLEYYRQRREANREAYNEYYRQYRAKKKPAAAGVG
jgi:alpha-D-ribose 1-methylphosphonate 5-triphosphate diphosphatase PhnM